MGIPADQKPYTKCPSVMKCVPKENCDFDGVMTNDIIQSTPELDMLRVPLIPCINRQRGNNIDVCCRDPNYKDPWPDMNGNNGNNRGNGNNGNNGNNRGNGNNGNGNNFQGNGNNGQGSGNNFQGNGSNNPGNNFSGNN